MSVGKSLIRLAAGVLIVFAITAQSAPAQEIPLEKRVQILESKVLYLEQQINELRALLSNSSIGRSVEKITPSKGNWKNQANWRYELKKGMTKQQVISLMGEPDKVDVYSLIGEAWHYGYPGGGTINFSNSGAVEMWSEPSPEDYK